MRIDQVAEPSDGSRGEPGAGHDQPQEDITMSNHDEINDRFVQQTLVDALRAAGGPIATETWQAKDDAVRTEAGTTACWFADGYDGRSYARLDWIAAANPRNVLWLLDRLEALQAKVDGFTGLSTGGPGEG